MGWPEGSAAPKAALRIRRAASRLDAGKVVGKTRRPDRAQSRPPHLQVRISWPLFTIQCRRTVGPFRPSLVQEDSPATSPFHHFSQV